MDPFTLRHNVRDLTEAVITRLGYDLVAIEWTGGPTGRSILRVSIDQIPGVGGSVSARDCAKVSKSIEPLLDASDPVKGAYVLEVSSPGIERPLQRISDFARFKGYKVRLRLESGPPRRRYTGELAGTHEQDVILHADGEEFRFHVDTIERAHLDLSLEQFVALGRDGAPTIPDISPDGTVASQADQTESGDATEDNDDHQ